MIKGAGNLMLSPICPCNALKTFSSTGAAIVILIMCDFAQFSLFVCTQILVAFSECSNAVRKECSRGQASFKVLSIFILLNLLFFPFLFVDTAPTIFYSRRIFAFVASNVSVLAKLFFLFASLRRSLFALF